MRIVVAVHEPPVWTIPESEVRRIQASLPSDEVIDARTAAERLRAFEGADVLVTYRLTKSEVPVLGSVKWIQSTAVGVAELLLPEIVASPIAVTNARGLHAEPIAEHAITLMLAVRRQIHTAVARQGARNWAQLELQRVHVPRLTESHAVVVGLGEIGSRVARLAAGLGMKVTGVRRRMDLPRPDGVQDVVPPERLRDILATADAVILAAPRTSETRAMIGAAEIAAMPPQAIIVNVARGRLIDDEALVAALEQGRIAGAGLDAFVREPLPDDHPYWRLPNVLMTPHTASFGIDYWKPAVDLFLENVDRFRRGAPLLNLVDKSLGY